MDLIRKLKLQYQLVDGKSDYNLCHGMQLKDCRQKCPNCHFGCFFLRSQKSFHVSQHYKENTCSIIINNYYSTSARGLEMIDSQQGM